MERVEELRVNLFGGVRQWPRKLVLSDVGGLPRSKQNWPVSFWVTLVIIAGKAGYSLDKTWEAQLLPTSHTPASQVLWTNDVTGQHVSTLQPKVAWHSLGIEMTPMAHGVSCSSP